MNAALLFFALIWHALGRRGGATGTWGPVWPEQAPILPSSAPPEWPQVVPVSSLPVFPGAGWEYDEPPPREVQARAGQLVQQLWQGGKGTYRIEQTAGRWIAYRAELVASGRQGVVAYRVRRAGASRSAPAVPSAPRVVPTSSTPMPGSTPGSRGMASRVLRLGDGLKPHPPDPIVKMLQERLGVPADGRFGNQTLQAVIAFQRSSGLVVDGVVGPRTWDALGWEALHERVVRT